ncbi:MAG: hypothetical protein Q9227_001262 [Pyrenula ochraceoflavens]
MDETEPRDFKVLVTAFGPFLDIPTNPSHSITTRLPPSLPTDLASVSVQLILLPNPLPVSYHTVLSTIPALLTEHRPDLVLHMGLDADRNAYSVETGADRDGYHQVPDMDRRVFTRAEGKAAWGKLPERMETTVDLEDVLGRWRRKWLGNSGEKGGAGGKKKGGKPQQQQQVSMPEIARSDDVGNYICGFIYYLSLAWYASEGYSGGKRPVVFFHVPWLESEEELERGKETTVMLIKAMVESVMEQ